MNNCCNENDDFERLHRNRCRPIFCLGATGPTGPTGPSGGPTGPTHRLFNSSYII